MVLCFSGGAAELSRVIDVGDEVLAINGRSLQGLMHYDAWNVIKTISEGPVQLVIRKPQTSVWHRASLCAVDFFCGAKLIMLNWTAFSPLFYTHDDTFLARGFSTEELAILELSGIWRP